MEFSLVFFNISKEMGAVWLELVGPTRNNNNSYRSLTGTRGGMYWEDVMWVDNIKNES
jgi:hypothetical protein